MKRQDAGHLQSCRGNWDETHEFCVDEMEEVS